MPSKYVVVPDPAMGVGKLKEIADRMGILATFRQQVFESKQFIATEQQLRPVFASNKNYKKWMEVSRYVRTLCSAHRDTVRCGAIGSVVVCETIEGVQEVEYPSDLDISAEEECIRELFSHPSCGTENGAAKFTRDTLGPYHLAMRARYVGAPVDTTEAEKWFDQAMALRGRPESFVQNDWMREFKPCYESSDDVDVFLLLRIIESSLEHSTVPIDGKATLKRVFLSLVSSGCSYKRLLLVLAWMFSTPYWHHTVDICDRLGLLLLDDIDWLETGKALKGPLVQCWYVPGTTTQHIFASVFADMDQLVELAESTGSSSGGDEVLLDTANDSELVLESIADYLFFEEQENIIWQIAAECALEQQVAEMKSIQEDIIKATIELQTVRDDQHRRA
jgi:hypothetical protein